MALGEVGVMLGAWDCGAPGRRQWAVRARPSASGAEATWRLGGVGVRL